MVMNSTLESRLVLKISTFSFSGKITTHSTSRSGNLPYQERKNATTVKVINTVSTCNANNYLITGWICFLRGPEQIRRTICSQQSFTSQCYNSSEDLCLWAKQNLNPSIFISFSPLPLKLCPTRSLRPGVTNLWLQT